MLVRLLKLEESYVSTFFECFRITINTYYCIEESWPNFQSVEDQSFVQFAGIRQAYYNAYEQCNLTTQAPGLQISKN